MRAVPFILLLFPVLMLAALACGGGDAESTTVAAPTRAAQTQTTLEPATATGESERETRETTEPAPTMEPTATNAPTETWRVRRAHFRSGCHFSPGSHAPPEDTPVPATVAPAPTEAPEEDPVETGAGPDSFLVGEGSQITFTVEEELNRTPVRFDAVITGTGLAGYANLDGSPSVIVLDLHSLESDQSFRDRYIRQRMFPETPVATVTFERLPDLPPTFFEGEETEGTLDGSLQIGENVAPLTFDVAARHDGSVINVLGRTTSPGSSWAWPNQSSAPWPIWPKRFACRCWLWRTSSRVGASRSVMEGQFGILRKQE